MFVQRYECELHKSPRCHAWFNVQAGGEAPAREEVLPSGWEWINLDGELVLACPACQQVVKVHRELE